MSPRKIFFFVIVGILFISLIATVAYISGDKKSDTKTAQGTIKIWITQGTTESYAPLLEWFKKYAKEYAKTEIIIEKQSNDADRYRTLLLSTLTEWNGPDIFMLQSGEDSILETKIEPIPSDVLNFSDFNKRYDDIFQDLITSTGSWKNKVTALRWVPLGYETLGIFYNKSLMREVPKTWNDLETIYDSSTLEWYPSNLGLGPTYTPNMIDIIPLWFNENDTKNYTDMKNGWTALESYLKYGTLKIKTTNTDGETDSQIQTLGSKKLEMAQQKLTTLDLFMQWEIAMIIGYPSLVIDLEKSSKRAGSKSSHGTILTEKIPGWGNTNISNIGKYSYFGISKLTKNGIASLKFMEYLLTPEAQRLFSNEYPYLIPAQSEFYQSVEWNSLSETLGRTTLSSFIPSAKMTITVFQYWLKSRFEKYLKEAIDITESPDTNTITSKISREIWCEINATLGLDKIEDCQSE
jgi:ABC-type glycerol-3-phosphate transport system substrate-binding protein